MESSWKAGSIKSLILLFLRFHMKAKMKQYHLHQLYNSSSPPGVLLHVHTIDQIDLLNHFNRRSQSRLFH
jgi:hypothetical protein